MKEDLATARYPQIRSRTSAVRDVSIEATSSAKGVGTPQLAREQRGLGTSTEYITSVPKRDDTCTKLQREEPMRMIADNRALRMLHREDALFNVALKPTKSMHEHNSVPMRREEEEL